MKIIIAPDSYKGTLTSEEVCECIETGIHNTEKECDIISVPLSDGGEGFADCLGKICKADVLYTDCEDIYSNPIVGKLYTFGKTAIIECACASGLQEKKDVMNASSYGTGELIKYAVEKGFYNIILGLGGSGCCDGGSGALQALGAVFYDGNKDIIPRADGGNLKDIKSTDFSKVVKPINFTYCCDVSNPYYGKNGAAYVFAPQKGANECQVKALDSGLKNLSLLLPNNISELEGGGAAGGLCAGLYSVYGGRIESGFDIIARACSLEEKIAEADIVITGEGKTDEQTLMGKLPYKVSELCKKHGTKCIVISGSIGNVSLGD